MYKSTAQKTGEYSLDQVVQLNFEVDDQSPEDLAIGLERIRDHEGTIDLVTMTAMGKKGRLTAMIQVLSKPDQVTEVANLCFKETKTLGIRESLLTRRILKRQMTEEKTDFGSVQVKSSFRPGGIVTAKTDIDSVAKSGGGFPLRDKLRLSGERSALGRNSINLKGESHG